MPDMTAMLPVAAIFVVLYVVLRRNPKARTENLEPIKSVLGFGKKGK